jgi:hypothetical protein
MYRITDLNSGKTTVARLYAKLLYSMDILHSPHVKETSGAKMAAKGVHYWGQKLKLYYQESPGLVLFVNEAYRLTAGHSSVGGIQVLDLLPTEMENNVGKLAVIFVGYRENL